jgi:hypothetical protein
MRLKAVFGFNGGDMIQIGWVKAVLAGNKSKKL